MSHEPHKQLDETWPLGNYCGEVDIGSSVNHTERENKKLCAGMFCSRRFVQRICTFYSPFAGHGVT